jgi:hypothetical protein
VAGTYIINVDKKIPYFALCLISEGNKVGLLKI